MRLRRLEKKDAPYMLEWMHDKNVTENLRGQFFRKKIEDCESFINNSYDNKNDIHLAIVSDEDEYMGTVSLKNVDVLNRCAEFAIVVRSSAMGNGYSWFGMREIIELAFNQYGQDYIYWCVSRNNNRAINFYQKHFFHIDNNIPEIIKVRYGNDQNLTWYSVNKKDGVKVINL